MLTCFPDLGLEHGAILPDIQTQTESVSVQVLWQNVQKQPETRRTHEKHARWDVHHVSDQNGALARENEREENPRGLERAVHLDQTGHLGRADNTDVQVEEATDVDGREGV